MLLLDPDNILQERRFTMAKTACADEKPKVFRDKTTPPARAPEVAAEEEYLAARQRSTTEALELFIARHPDSPWVEKARNDLRRLQR
jgi:hypothetical protein